MFGTYRLVLAILVVVSHLHVTFAGINPGVAAVVQFFIVSGFVMTALIGRHYSGIGRRTLWFWADRALRIFPQYLFFLALTGLWAWSWPQYLRGEPTVAVIVAHVVVFPLNLYPFWDDLQRAFLLPQASSLALEEQFYLLFPFLLARRTLGIAVLAVSFVVFGLAAAGRIDRGLHTYVVPTGTLCIFLAGSAIQRWSDGVVRTRWIVLIWCAFASLAALLATRGKLTLAYNDEILMGVLVGIPVVALLAKLPQRPLDDALGRTSYGVFLGHMIPVTAASRWIGDSWGPVPTAVAVVAASIALGWFGWWIVERPTARLRHELRRRRAA